MTDLKGVLDRAAKEVAGGPEHDGEGNACVRGQGREGSIDIVEFHRREGARAERKAIIAQIEASKDQFLSVVEKLGVIPGGWLEFHRASVRDCFDDILDMLRGGSDDDG